MKKHKETGSVVRKKDSGRQLSLHEIAEQLIKTEITSNNRISRNEMSRKLFLDYGINVSKWTIGRKMMRLGYNSCFPAFKPKLEANHINIRYNICKEWAMWPKIGFII